MGLFEKVTDKIASKISGTTVETIQVDIHKFVSLLDEHFLSKASGDSEYDAINKIVKGSLFKNLEMTSKDNRYRLVNNAVDPNSFSRRYVIWIIDDETHTLYQYNCGFSGSFKKTVAKRIADYKAGIADSAHIEIVADENDRTEDVAHKCPACGAELAPDAKFCIKCGTPILEESQKKYCPSCGAELAENAVFCIKCGTKI